MVDSDHSEFELTNEENSLMVSNPRQFEKKKFPSNKNRNWPCSYSSEKTKGENANGLQKEEEKKEKKLVVTLAMTAIIVMAKTI